MSRLCYFTTLYHVNELRYAYCVALLLLHHVTCCVMFNFLRNASCVASPILCCVTFSVLHHIYCAASRLLCCVTLWWITFCTPSHAVWCKTGCVAWRVLSCLSSFKLGSAAQCSEFVVHFYLFLSFYLCGLSRDPDPRLTLSLVSQRVLVCIISLSSHWSGSSHVNRESSLFSGSVVLLYYSESLDSVVV